VHGARFVFLSIPQEDKEVIDESPGSAVARVVWMLVSPNNRSLGRARVPSDTYAEGLEAVHRLKRHQERLKPVSSTVDATGAWAWRVDLEGETVAVSSRSYLRVRECHYNLERFLEAVPIAGIVAGTRVVRRGGRGDVGAPVAVPRSFPARTR
jgi:hypothetical protein